jgi:hypothetical protein
VNRVVVIVQIIAAITLQSSLSLVTLGALIGVIILEVTTIWVCLNSVLPLILLNMLGIPDGDATAWVGHVTTATVLMLSIALAIVFEKLEIGDQAECNTKNPWWIRDMIMFIKATPYMVLGYVAQATLCIMPYWLYFLGHACVLMASRLLSRNFAIYISYPEGLETPEWRKWLMQ